VALGVDIIRQQADKQDEANLVLMEARGDPSYGKLHLLRERRWLVQNKASRML
jgi:hypothetical protein